MFFADGQDFVVADLSNRITVMNFPGINNEIPRFPFASIRFKLHRHRIHIKISEPTNHRQNNSNEGIYEMLIKSNVRRVEMYIIGFSARLVITHYGSDVIN